MTKRFCTSQVDRDSVKVTIGLGAISLGILIYMIIAFFN